MNYMAHTFYRIRSSPEKIYVVYKGCSKSFANRYTENTQSIGI